MYRLQPGAGMKRDARSQALPLGRPWVGGQLDRMRSPFRERISDTLVASGAGGIAILCVGG